MKRAGPFTPSVERQQTLDQGTYALQSMEDRSVATIRNPFSDLHQFIIRREAGLHKEPEEQPFHRQAIPAPLLFHSPTSLHTAHWLTPSTSQRVDMNLKRAGAWIGEVQIIQQDPERTKQELHDAGSKAEPEQA